VSTSAGATPSLDEQCGDSQPATYPQRTLETHLDNILTIPPAGRLQHCRPVCRSESSQDGLWGNGQMAFSSSFFLGWIYGAHGTPKVLMFADDSNFGAECRFSPAPSSAAPTPTLQDTGC